MMIYLPRGEKNAPAVRELRLSAYDAIGRRLDTRANNSYVDHLINDCGPFIAHFAQLTWVFHELAR